MTANPNAFCGKLVRLATPDLEKDPQIMACWSQDSQYLHLLDLDPARPHAPREIKEWLEKDFNKNLSFTIRTMAEDKLIGELGLGGINWTAGDAWLGVGIGDSEYWGKGYGSEAIDLLLRYAFESLNLRRVSLDVFEHNPRAIKAYLKLGFTIEGRGRQWINRDERRWDLVYMGILRREWEARQPAPVLER